MFKKKKLTAIFVALVMSLFVAFYATTFVDASGGKLECEDFSDCHDVGGCDGPGRIKEAPCTFICDPGWPIIDCVKLEV